MHMEDDIKTLVFFPALNEELTVGNIVTQVRLLYPRFDLLVVDDGSSDHTGLNATNAGAKVLRLPFNVGVGGAVGCALRYAFENNYDELFQIDADGQHNPKYIRELQLNLRGGADLAVGSRFGGISQYPIGRLRRMIIRILASINGNIIRGDISDPTSGFRGFNRRAIEALQVDFPTEYLGDTIECLLLAHHANLVIGEVAVEMKERQGGEPSAGPLKSLGYLLRAIFAIFVSQLRHTIAKPRS